MNQSQRVIVTFITLFSLVGWARVDIEKMKVLKLPSDLSNPLISESQKNRIIPKSIRADETAHDVLAKMADNTVSLWWDTTPLRQTSIGQAADAAEKKLNVKAEFEDKDKVKHCFNLKVLAMQALARLEYKGWVHAAISYDARAAKTEAEISEKINSRQDFIISHSITSFENKSLVGLRWKW